MNAILEDGAALSLIASCPRGLADLLVQELNACGATGRSGLFFLTADLSGRTDLRPKQLPTRRPAVELVDEFDEGLRQDVRMRHRHPVARLDVAPP